jgi:LacI family transcriptional regulator
MADPAKISQTQLAQELGVSQALVSLVLNGRKQGISPETYDRIWAHAVKRGYHPKGMRLASSPAAARPQSVGIILRAPMRLSTIGNYFGHVQHGLHTALAPHELSTVFLGAEDELDADRLTHHFRPGHAFQGVVIFGEVQRSFLERLRRHERRIVVVSARFPGLCHSVLGNEPQALEQLVRHLTEHGHRRIAWLGGNRHLSRHTNRLQAFQRALEEAGLKFNPRYSIELQHADRAEGAEALHHLLEHTKRTDFPTAAICYNSLMAQGAARACVRHGWEVPEDFSIAGADAPRTDLEEHPRVTGAGSSPERLGETAARLVLNSTGADDEPFMDMTLPSQLVVGESTGAAPELAGRAR